MLHGGPSRLPQAPRKIVFSDSPARMPDRSLRLFSSWKENFFCQLFPPVFRMEDASRLVSARRHDPSAATKTLFGVARVHEDPPRSARESSSPMYVHGLCRRPRTCTFHSRREIERAHVGFSRADRKSRSNPTAQPRSPQSMRSACESKMGFHVRSRIIGLPNASAPRFRNRKLPGAPRTPATAQCTSPTRWPDQPPPQLLKESSVDVLRRLRPRQAIRQGTI